MSTTDDRKHLCLFLLSLRNMCIDLLKNSVRKVNLDLNFEFSILCFPGILCKFQYSWKGSRVLLPGGTHESNSKIELAKKYQSYKKEILFIILRLQIFSVLFGIFPPEMPLCFADYHGPISLSTSSGSRFALGWATQSPLCNCQVLR